MVRPASVVRRVSIIAQQPAVAVPKKSIGHNLLRGHKTRQAPLILEGKSTAVAWRDAGGHCHNFEMTG